MAITKEQIFALADELDAAGQRPTLAAVRKTLGGGSFTTISEAMNEWRGRKNAQTSTIREPAPQAVTDKLAELGGDLWAVALEMANSRLAGEREALEVLRGEMEAARQEAAELADQLTIELDDARARMASLEMAEAAARAETESLRERLSAVSEQAASAVARAGELRTELDHAHHEAASARAEHEKSLERVRAELVAQHVISRDLAGERDQVRASLASVKAKANAEQEAHNEQRQAAAQEAHRQAERLTIVQRERDEARDEAATLRGRAEALESLRPVTGSKPGEKKN